MSKLIDMTGQKFGKLVVLGYAGSMFRGRAARAAWHCRCECGVEKIISGAHLREGDAQSCGCAKSRTLAAAPRDG
jgi:hypothetical protein